jgi:hypothetical protein
VLVGKTLTLGTILLERSASVAGWAAVENGTIDEGKCIARLAPLLAGQTDIRASANLERTAIERTVRKDGFFQLAGISPGNYALEVSQPGYSPARLSPVRVEPRAATYLSRPLVLSRPLELVFAIDPPLDWLGRPWHARVSRARGAERLAPTVFDGGADAEGRFTVPGQSAGRFAVTVADSLGNRLYSEDHLQVADPGTAPVPIQIKLVDVEGRLHLGDQAVAGTVWFGGQNGAIAVKMPADTEGRFHGVLPRAGFWFLEIESTSPPLRLRKELEVPASRSGKARVDISLPDTRIFGHVLDAQGKPAPRAEVLIEGRDPLQPVEADESGAFEMRGVREGASEVSASLGSQTSESRPVVVVEGREVGPIELHLRQVEKWTGTVLSALGPVPGSRVIVQPVQLTNGTAAGTVGTDGSFTVELPSDVRQVIAYVSAPGFPLQVFGPLEVSALTLKLTDQGGNLKIDLPGSGDAFQRQSLGLAAFVNGLPLPIGLLRQWAAEQGEPPAAGGSTFQIPNVSAGDYRLCIVARERVSAILNGADPGASVECDSGSLAQGATLALKPGSR